ncbi:MAG: response regulator transcription factor [Archangium sp.]|nr:response regulator transcription factor [Archangium sp.]
MGARRRILVVEDETAIRLGLVDALQFAGFSATEAASAPEAMRVVEGATFDLALVDLVLPGGSGLSVVAHARKVQPGVPIIAVTALGSEEQRIEGLNRGVDDYVVKPFSVRELLARISAVLRRSAERSDAPREIRVGAVTIDLARREVRERGEVTPLSERETELLSYLTQNAGRAVSRDELLRHVWHLEPGGVATRTIDMTVSRLREKTGGDSLIRTLRGKGYLLATAGEAR